MDEKIKALLGLNISIFLMGASGLFGKIISTSAFFIVFGRVMFAAIALFLFQKWRKKKILPENYKDAGIFAVLGAIMAFHWFAFFHSIQVSTVAIGLLSFSTFTVFTTLLEPVYFKTKLTMLDCLLAFLCCVGVAFIVGIGGENGKPEILYGVIWGVLAGASYALMLLINKSYVSRYSPITLTFYQCLVAMLCLLPIVLWMQENVSVVDWGYLFIHGVVFTAFAFSLYVFSARHIEAQVISIVAMLEIFYGIVLAYFLLGEELEIRMIFGGILILAASYMAVQKVRS